MITVREAIELLRHCNPDAIIRIAMPEDDYSENVSFIQECDQQEVHFCNTKPEQDPSFNDYLDDKSDFWVEAINETDNFSQIKTYRASNLIT